MDEGTGNGTGATGETNHRLIRSTIHSYIMLTAEQAKKQLLSEEQTTQIKTTWQETGRSRKKSQNEPGEEDDRGDMHIKDIEQAAQEVKELLILVIGCDITNTIHSAKLQRLGENHIAKAKEFNGKVKAEIVKAKKAGE